ncbi:MAG TPA: class I SAM-dependent methyltransferase [Candidatus Paceibacterota bacterium]
MNTALKNTYNKIAVDWHKDHSSDNWWISSTDAFISMLKQGDHVLDVGCGGGTKSKYLFDNELEVTGIDFSEKMIDIARRQVPRGEFHILDLKDIKKLKDSFDGIFIQAVLLHIPKKEIEKTLRIIIKKLNNNGYLYVAVKENNVKGIEEEIKVEHDYGYKYQRFFSYFSLDEMKSYFKKIGLKIVFAKVISSGDTRWIQVIGKKDHEK